MKRLQLFLLFALLLPLGAQAQGGVQFFQGTWEELLAESNRTGRPIFVDMYTDWCGWCKVMDRKTFSDESVAQYVAGNYIAYKLNAERGEGPALTQRFRVQGFPTVVLLNYKGEHITNIVGFKEAPEFLQLLKSNQAAGARAGGPQGNARNGRNQGTQNATAVPSATMADYIGPKDLAMTELENSLLASNEAFQTAAKKALALGQARDRYGYEDFTEELTALTDPQRKIVNAYYLMGRADYEALSSFIDENQTSLEPGWLHFFAWQFFKQPGDAPLGHSPMRWVNDACRRANSYAVLDTKAALKYRDGKYDEALEVAEQALRQARTEGTNATRTEVLVRLIKARQQAG